jgi:hypothetical protein
MPLSIDVVEVEVGELILGSKVLVRGYLDQGQGGLGALSWVDGTRLGRALWVESCCI